MQPDDPRTLHRAGNRVLLLGVAALALSVWFHVTHRLPFEVAAPISLALGVAAIVLLRRALGRLDQAQKLGVSAGPARTAAALLLVPAVAGAAWNLLVVGMMLLLMGREWHS